MVSAAFLKEFTGIEISFLDWFIFAFPAALITVPAAVAVVYLVFRPDPEYRLPEFDEKPQPWTALEIKTLLVSGLVLVAWFTKGLHGLDYSVTGMIGGGPAGAHAGAGVAGHPHQPGVGHRPVHFRRRHQPGLGHGGFPARPAISPTSSSPWSRAAAGCSPVRRGWGYSGPWSPTPWPTWPRRTLILPIVIPLAQLEGVDPRILALCLGMSTSFAMLLVIGCPPNAIAYSFRQFKAFDLTKAGLVATPILLGLLILVAAVWWHILGLVVNGSTGMPGQSQDNSVMVVDYQAAADAEGPATASARSDEHGQIAH